MIDTNKTPITTETPTTAETQTLYVHYAPATLMWDGGTRPIKGAEITLKYDDGQGARGEVGPREGDSIDCWMDAALISHCGTERPDPVFDAIEQARDLAIAGKSGTLTVEIDAE